MSCMVLQLAAVLLFSAMSMAALSLIDPTWGRETLPDGTVVNYGLLEVSSTRLMAAIVP